jgi:signal transduction histidine kinase/ActR/RegA family two-component response regulator
MRDPEPQLEALIGALLAASEDPLLLLDVDGKILAANPATLEVLPGPLGESLLERCGADARDAFAVALTGKTASFGAALGGRHLVWRLLPVPGDGQRARVVASGRDTAEVIRERRDLFQKVLDALPIGVNIFSPKLMRTFYMNDAYVTIHGWPREIVMDGHALHEHTLPDPEVRRRVIGKINADVASGDPARMRWTIIDIVTQQGERRHILAVNTPMPELELQVGTVQDVTELWRTRQELQQAQRMESIGRLAGGVAHDFNNLLTAILGNVSLAQLDLAAPSLPQYLSEIGQAAESAAALTRQLLSFSRRQMIEPRVIDLGEVLRRLERLLVRTLGEDVELRVSARARDRIRIDVAQLEQIVMNLAVNARDAMPGGGLLQIETEDVVLDEAYCARHALASRPGPHVLLAVTDSGCGLTEEVRAHLFEPFFTSKPQGKGTGLGLATVYGAVKQNGGLIDVYSEPGRGTCFKIFFPRVSEASEVLPPPEVQAFQELPRGCETILLVEDDHRVRRFATQLLGQIGYHVLSTANGAEALALLRARTTARIDLLFTDVVLPGISGRELAEVLQAEREVTRVLFTSGYTEDVIIRHGVLARGIAFLPKPYTSERLAQKVREVLDQREAP